MVRDADSCWEHLYVTHVMGADTGADLDFLRGSSGYAVSVNRTDAVVRASINFAM